MGIATHSLELALISAAVLGFRHGFDYDHIAAISDITSVQTKAVGVECALGLLYALGHAATVAVLGSAVILFQLSLPEGMDRIAERLVGITLLILGVYVLDPYSAEVPYPQPFSHYCRSAALAALETEEQLARHEIQTPVRADGTTTPSRCS